MPTAVFTPDALDDVDGAYHDYERRLVGLGERFLASLRRSVGLIEQFPELHGEIVPGVRAGPLRKFPYVVYYRGSPQRVVVIAVRPGGEHPSVWQSRV